MNFGTHIVEVSAKQHANFQLHTLPSTRDFLNGSRVVRASRENSLFWFDHFFPRSPFYPGICPFWMNFSTHIVKIINQLHAKFQLSTLRLTRDFVIGSRVGRASREI